MTFWDSSALVALLLNEANSATARVLYRSDSCIAVWWASQVECASAIGRRFREGLLDDDGAGLAIQRLRQLAAGWTETEPTVALRQSAMRLVHVHPLRASDALQLAAALLVANGQPET